jgi:putative membrane protein
MSQPVADRRLHPATLVSKTLRTIPEAAGGMVAYGAVIARAEFATILLLALAGLVVAAIGALLSWWRFRYGVGEREIVIEAGVISRKRRVIPFERVQDIAIEQRLLARVFGTAAVKIETGGAAADEGHLDSIALADAHRLRDHIRGWKAAAGGATDSAGQRDAAEQVLFAMTLGRVLYSGLFNFSLVFVAGVFAVLQNADELGLYAASNLLVPFESSGRRLWIVASLSLLLAVLLVGIVAGVLRTMARDYGFRLTRAPNGLRRRRGLITLSETVIPVRRIQLAAIESGFVARTLGWHRLAFQTLGAEPRGRGAQVAAPFARMEEILPILAQAAYPDPLLVGDWARSPKRSILRRALVPATAALAAFALAFVWPIAVIPGGILFLLAAAAPLRWSRHRRAFGSHALFVSGGVLRRGLRIMPYARAQAITVSAGPIQCPLGLASVIVDTAGAPAARTLALIDLDDRVARALADRLLALLKEHRALRRREHEGGL